MSVSGLTHSDRSKQAAHGFAHRSAHTHTGLLNHAETILVVLYSFRSPMALRMALYRRSTGWISSKGSLKKFKMSMTHDCQSVSAEYGVERVPFERVIYMFGRRSNLRVFMNAIFIQRVCEFTLLETEIFSLQVLLVFNYFFCFYF